MKHSSTEQKMKKGISHSHGDVKTLSHSGRGRLRRNDIGHGAVDTHVDKRGPLRDGRVRHTVEHLHRHRYYDRFDAFTGLFDDKLHPPQDDRRVHTDKKVPIMRRRDERYGDVMSSVFLAATDRQEMTRPADRKPSHIRDSTLCPFYSYNQYR